MATQPNLPRAILPNPNNPNHVYFFAGNQYAQIEINPAGTDSLLSSPRRIDQDWPSLRAANFPVVDAALPFPSDRGKAYIFSKDQYVSIAINPGTTTNTIISGPRRIVDYWPSLRLAGFTTVDAVLPRQDANDEVYFFSGKLFAVIKVIPGTPNDYVITGPLVITEKWPSLKTAGFSTLDAVLPSPKGNGEAFVFSGILFAVIKVDSGTYADRLIQEPRKVSECWPSLNKAGFY